MEKPRLRIIHWAIIFLVGVVALVMRVSNHEEVLKNYTGHFNFLDPDSYYQLRRLVHFIENFPHVMRFDSFLDWPTGANVDWPPALVWVYGLPLKIFGVSNFHSLELGVTAITLALAIVSLFIFWKGIQRFVPDRRFDILALFLAAMSPILIRYTSMGQIDHHILELILPPLALILSSLWMEKKSFIYPILLAALVGFSIWSSSILLFLALWVPSFVALLVNRKFCLKEIFVFWVCFILFTTAAILDIKNFPIFSQKIIFVAMGCSVFLASTIYSLRKFRQKSWKFIVPISIFALFFYHSQFRYLFYSAFNYFFPSEDILTAVVEAQPTFGKWSEADIAFVHQHFGFLFIPVFLIFPFTLFFRWRAGASKALELLVFSVPVLFLVLAQRRLEPLGGVIYLWIVILFLSDISNFLLSRGLRVASAFGILFLAMMLTPALQQDFILRFSEMHAVDLPVQKLFLEYVPTKEETAWNRLAGKEKIDYGIFSHPNLGHNLTYITGIPSVQNSFFHTRTLKEDLDRRSLREDQELVRALQKEKIRYVLVADDLRYHQFLWKLFNKSDFPLVGMENQNGRLVKTWDLDSMDEYAWYRLLTQKENPKQIKFLYGLTVERTNHFYKNVKVFEVGGF